MLAVLTFDVDAESVVLAEDARHADNPMLMSHQAYGPEVGVPRLLLSMYSPAARTPITCRRVISG